MYTVLIAGVGQLGSRHLQGVALSSLELDIWVYDISTDSLKVAEERYNQVESPTNKHVHFVQSFCAVPSLIDVAIVASSSKPRFAIISELLTEHHVKYLILEKFLFTRMQEYDDTAILLKNKQVRAFVNCPRRIFESYNIIKEHIDRSHPVTMSVIGKDWGLCCNSIHFIDIFMMLTGESDFFVNIDHLIPEVIESKRSGYIELRGVEIISTSKGSTLTLSSTNDFGGPSKLTISNGNTTISLDETTGNIIINGAMYKSTVQYQSDLSGIVVDNLIKHGHCQLTPYEESAHYHKTFLSYITPFINKLQGWESDSCPIT